LLTTRCPDPGKALSKPSGLPRSGDFMNIPSATYRIQFTPATGFSEIAGVLSYLADLGITHVYASPVFQAKKASDHGYDVVDPNRLNPEFGTEIDFASLIDTLRLHGMGWIQDIVPNHMAYDQHNTMLMDILEHGSSSQYFRYFDIDWDHHLEGLKGRLLTPFLGSHFGEALESGEISLIFGRDGLEVAYYDLKFPVRPGTYANLLTYRLESLRNTLGEEHPDFIKLLGILYVIKTLPQELDQERYHQTTFIKRMLWEVYRGNSHIKAFIEMNLRIFNGQNDNPDRFGLIESLLSEQFFRLAYWKVATKEINYRRFFNINGLISCCVQDPAVFEDTHQYTLELVNNGIFSGLRIDHVDGLYDPLEYLVRLREKVPDVYIVVEKILHQDEALPNSWPIQGTSGYDFLNIMTQLLCNPDNDAAITRIYADFSGIREPLREVVRHTKRLIAEEHMAGDVDNLAQLLKRISGRDRHGSDITLQGLHRAMTEVLIEFPVYRSYVSNSSFSESDRHYISEALGKAMARSPGLKYELEFLKRFLLLEYPDYLSDEERAEWLRFTMKFQQFTGPLMAKGFEDTALYVYNRLLSLNEVGGVPDRCGIPTDDFHRIISRRRESWPHSMNATATHDTKRGEDMRARISVLSELPDEWETELKKWHAINTDRKRILSGKKVPDKNDEYFLYQTLVGSFPFDEAETPEFVERVKDYVVKAVREAKVHTEWIRPDTAYEEAYLAFVEDILKPDSAFLEAFLPFQRKIAHYGILNSLSQVVLKVTVPGVADFYQGSDLWDLNLVDPDNRRPVDYPKRRHMLTELRQKSGHGIRELIEELICTKEDGRIKLFCIHRLLAVRRLMPNLFLKGNYLPLKTAGVFGDRIVAFARGYEDRWGITIAPRLLSAVVSADRFPLGKEVWQDTTVILPNDLPDEWRDFLTNSEVRAVDGALSVGEALASFPAILLINEN
jgi:(1->4)-alpha-D-glucan 1-alpha-D-glucosylmutase